MGNCYLGILETAGKFPTKNSSGKAKNIRSKPLVRMGEVPLPVNVSCENTAGYSATVSTGKPLGNRTEKTQENYWLLCKIISFIFY